MREATVRSARAQAGTNGSRKERVGLRGVLHVLVVSAGWALFFAWWWEVLHITSLQEAAVAVLVILSVSLLTALATAGWVRYNLGIYRRKGPRRTVPDVPEDVGTDALGRRLVHPGTEELRAEAVLDARGEAGVALVKEVLLMTGWRAFAPKTGLFVGPADLEALAALAAEGPVD